MVIATVFPCYTRNPLLAPYAPRMSAFFFAINLDQTPFDPALAANMQQQLGRYGVDGAELLINENYAVGYQRHWTVPEEVGEKQPLVGRESKLILVFHGRLDNRDKLLAKLNLQTNDQLSDAQLLLALYEKYAEEILPELIGPFSLLIFCPQTGHVVAARDSMGGRTLSYKITSKVAVFATDEMALAAHPEVGYQINPIKAVRFLTHAMDGNPTSPLQGVTPVKPGEFIQLAGKKVVKSVFYLPDPAKRILGLSDTEYAAEFRRLLEQAVARRLRAVGSIGTMLSGGLDSVPITISAAQLMDDESRSLTAYSWVFDKFPEADERRYSGPLCKRLQIKQQLINCDSVWPQFDKTTATNPLVPFSTPYTAFNQALFGAAQSQGTKVLLSGIGGDMLYTGAAMLPRELLRQGRIAEAARELIYAFRAVGSGRKFLSAYFVSPWKRNFMVEATKPEWLAEGLAERLQDEPSWLANQQRKALRPTQYFNAVGGLEGEDACYGRYFEAPYKIERRFPFRDRELVEFMLGIPTEQLFFKGELRPIVRRAYDLVLSEDIKARKNKTSFQAVINAGMAGDEGYKRFLEGQNLAVKEYVNICYLSEENPYFQTHKEVPWRCAYYEFWKTSCYTSHAQKLG